MPGSVIHTVNYAEVLSKLAERGLSPTAAEQQMNQVGLLQVIRIDPGDPQDAHAVARLRPLTRSLGLSLGDRYCLALAERLGVPAGTTDRVWATLSVSIPVEVLS